MSDAIIKMTGCVIRQQKETILKNINLEIQNGEFIYLIGKVGSGKSSFLKTLYAELPLAYGSAEVAGFQLKKLKKSQIPLLRRKCGIVFQDFKLLIDRDIYKNLEFVLRATGWKNKKAIQERIETVLTKVGMLEKQHQMPHRLSGGEQQRIVLARALLNAPPLILADEPTGNIDPETSYQLIELLKEISDTGKTVIIATHQYDLIEKYPGRVFCCDNGELVEQEPSNIRTTKAIESIVVPPQAEIEESQQTEEEKSAIVEEAKAIEDTETIETKTTEAETIEAETIEKPNKVEESEEVDEGKAIDDTEKIDTKAVEESETVEEPEIIAKPETDLSSLIGKLDYPEITAFDYELEEQNKEHKQTSVSSPTEEKLPAEEKQSTTEEQSTENDEDKDNEKEQKDKNPPLVMDLELI